MTITQAKALRVGQEVTLTTIDVKGVVVKHKDYGVCIHWYGLSKDGDGHVFYHRMRSIHVLAN